jgi:hypothetical protein
MSPEHSSIMFGKVEAVFTITGRGCVAVFRWLEEDPLVASIRLRPGDQIRLRAPDGQFRDTRIAALEIVCGSNDRNKAGIMLPREINKQDVPPGTEIWSLKP